MSFFTDDYIEQVRNANDIVELIGEHVQLRRSGRNFLGLCPFHAEKTPSFSVSPEKQMYYCFGCHASGTVFNFVMETAKISFPEAVRTLAMRANIPLPEAAPKSKEAQAKQKERQLLYRVNQWAAEYFHNQLRQPEAKEAREYLARRGISVALVEKMKLGYAPDGWTNLVAAAERGRVPIAPLVKLGLIAPRQQDGYYDRFRARLMIPIADERGRIVAFGGRVLDHSLPKYLNSPESALFDKGRLLFGLHYANSFIRKAGNAVLVEGYMDCLSAWQFGIGNVVASLGTALTSAQARLLKRYTNQVILCYDADGSGIRAALRGLDLLLKAGLQVRVATLPNGQDPDDCLRQKGAEYFLREILEKAQPVVDFQLAMLRREYDLNTVEGKSQFVAAASALLATLDNEVAKIAYAQQIAYELQVPESAVLAELAKHGQASRPYLRDKLGNSRNTTRSVEHATVAQPDPILRGYQIAEDKLLNLIISNQVEGRELLLSWQALDAYAHPADRELVSLLLKELQEEQVLDGRRLLERVDNPEITERLAQVMWTENIELEKAAVVARDCLDKLKHLAINQSIAAVQEKLRLEKDSDERKQLLQQLQELLEMQKGMRH